MLFINIIGDLIVFKNMVEIMNGILESWEAAEIAEEHGLKDEAEGAAMWFNEVCYEAEWQQEEMPKYSKFLKRIEGGDLYYDFGADYYFLVKGGMTNESKKTGKKTVIKLTESDLKNIIRESVNRILKDRQSRI